MEWPVDRQGAPLAADVALLLLVVPGAVIATAVLVADGAPWQILALVLTLEVVAVALLLSLVWYLHRGLRYRLSAEAVEVRGLRQWLRYPKSQVQRVTFDGIEARVLSGLKWGLNGLSGLAHGRFQVEPFGWCHVHGNGQLERAVVLELPSRRVVLTPEKPGEFLAHLAAWGYPVAGLGQQLKEAS